MTLGNFLIKERNCSLIYALVTRKTLILYFQNSDTYK